MAVCIAARVRAEQDHTSPGRGGREPLAGFFDHGRLNHDARR
jgi:hypothetical protein